MVKNAKAEVWCRNCGEKMKQYPYGILAFYCKKCDLKAEVGYCKIPKLKLSPIEFTSQKAGG